MQLIPPPARPTPAHSHKDSEARIEFRIASNQAERLAAYRLVYERYFQRGFVPANPFRMRVTPYHLLPTTQTFIAFQEGKIAASVSLIGDGDLGLPMESIYAREVQAARSRGLFVGEVSCLASRHDDFRKFLPLFVQLTRLMAQFARAQGMHQFLIAIHPKHARFYERFMGFEQIGPLRDYPSVQGAPAVACCLDFARIDQLRPKCWDDFFGSPLPESKLHHQSMSRDEVDYFYPASQVKEAHLLIPA